MRQTLYRRRMMSKADEEDGRVARTAGPSNRPPDGIQSSQAPSLSGGVRSASCTDRRREGMRMGAPQEVHRNRGHGELPAQQQRHAPAAGAGRRGTGSSYRSGPAAPVAPLVSRLPGRTALLKQTQETEGGIPEGPWKPGTGAAKQGEQAQEAEPWAPGYLFVWSPRTTARRK